MAGLVGTPATFEVTAGTSVSTYTAETGSDRLVVVILSHEQTSNGQPVATVSFGGQAMTPRVQAEYQISGSTAYNEQWYLPEASIPSGAQSLTTTGTGTQNLHATIMTLEDRDQAPSTSAPYVNSDGDSVANALSAAVTTVVGEFVTAGACYVAGTAAFDAWGNSFTEVIDVSFNSAASQATSAYKDATSTTETATVDSSATTSSNEQVLTVAVWPAAGVAVNSVTDPFTTSMTIVLSEAAPDVDTITITSGSIEQSQSFTTSDNITFTISSITRNLLPAIDSAATIQLKDGVTVIASTTAAMATPAGTQAVVVTVPNTGNPDSVFYSAYTISGSAEGGDQLQLTGNGTITETGLLTATEPVAVRHWDSSEEAWGEFSAWPVGLSAGGSALLFLFW